MKAIDITHFGGPEVLELTEQAKPEPAAGEVLIRVCAAGVNRPDIVQRKGYYPPPAGASLIPGLEVAGEIVASNGDMGDFQIGDRVCALVTGGGYSEYVAAPACVCLPIPQGLSMVEAAALPETFFTVWSNLFERGGLKSGQSVLIHGGASGIGTTAIQLAKRVGARVFVTAGSEQKCRFCEELGADVVLNYKEQDFVEEVLKLTEGDGVDLILDMVGGDYLDKNLTAIAQEGTLVCIAFQRGQKAQLDLKRLMQKRVHITGSTLRAREITFKQGIADALRKHVYPWIAAGEVKPVIDRVFDLADADKAHAYLESGEHLGKVVLQVAGE
ncbi:NAD(P)H-quinone oxidoreductase [Dongshaea marina]|uniref:NAD(P)H-quinone oxidoreductase n=1 Tax=Dongshaea marina TaxID=2047966 RepID=UPI000D3EC6FE|nr:NAD(P)H-quinone oxidoreductase [Dongshaea marina]